MTVSSYLRERLCNKIIKAFLDEGLECIIDPHDIIPVSGYWKSQDVFRWEVFCQLKKEGYVHKISLGSYDTMTECANKGLVLSMDQTYGYRTGFIGNSWEAHRK